MIKKINYFFQGYLLIVIRGNALERFIDQIVNSGIALWDLETINSNYYRAKIKVCDFNGLRPLVRKRLCRVKIINKMGFPFILLKIKKRSYLIIGLIFFITIFFTASSFVWIITIEGLETISEDEVYQVLIKLGIKPGTLKASVDLPYIERILLRKIPRISWLDLELQGSKLYLEIVEKKLVELERPEKIVANRSGVISRLIPLEGRAVVSEGNTVLRGQTLIVAESHTEYEKPLRAVVKAYVWYETLATTDLLYKKAIFTGDNTVNWSLQLGDNIYRLPFFKPSFAKYEININKKTLSQWTNIMFPVELVKERYREIEYLTIERNPATALFLAREKALISILPRLGLQAVILEIDFAEFIDKTNNQVKVRLVIKTEEEIGVSDFKNK